MEHPLVARLRAHPVSGVVRSNAPEMVWLATGQPARMLRPSRKLERELAADVAASGRPCTVVWFMEDGKPVLHVDEIAAEVDVERAWEGPRGLLVIARPRAGER
jgi:hypothetical protein